MLTKEYEVKSLWSIGRHQTWIHSHLGLSVTAHLHTCRALAVAFQLAICFSWTDKKPQRPGGLSVMGPRSRMMNWYMLRKRLTCAACYGSNISFLATLCFFWLCRPAGLRVIGPVASTNISRLWIFHKTMSNGLLLEYSFRPVEIWFQCAANKGSCRRSSYHDAVADWIMGGFINLMELVCRSARSTFL